MCRVFNTRNCDFNPLTGEASYAIYTITFKCTCTCGFFFKKNIMHWIYQTCPKCDKKLIGMVKTTGDVPTFRMSPVSGLKTQNCPRKLHARARTHTHTHQTAIFVESIMMRLPSSASFAAWWWRPPTFFFWCFLCTFLSRKLSFHAMYMYFKMLSE